MARLANVVVNEQARLFHLASLRAANRMHRSRTNELPRFTVRNNHLLTVGRDVRRRDDEPS
jgi:hypothetical protein